jgi:MFS family permease
LGVVLNAAGSGLYLTGSTLYFLNGIGLSTAQIGLGLTIAGLVGFATTVPVSLLANVLGPLTLLRILQVWRAAWLIALAFADDQVMFILCVSMAMISQGPIFPMVQLLADKSVKPEGRSRLLGLLSSLINVGMSIGTLAAAPLLGWENQWALRSIILAGAVCSVASAVAFSFLRMGRPAEKALTQNWYAGLLTVGRDHRYIALSVVNGILFMHPVLLSVAIPLWVVSGSDVSPAIVPALFLTNTVLAIVFQVQVAKNIKSTRAGIRAMIIAGAALALFSLALILSQHLDVRLAVALLISAIVLLTFGELFQGAGSWELSIRHAPEAKRPEYLAVFSLGGSIANILGPALVGVVIAWGARGMLALAAIFVAAIVLLIPLGRSLERSSL